ncbi:MAG: DUF2807 domain-containing protein [Alphaproteobacteria bacterium]|nr:DUF2807 domain-containing protein [Alphaproteobacteria bacterium]
MSLFLKLGLVGIGAGAAGLVTLGQLADIRGPVEMPALAGFTGLIGIGASAAGTGGPVDQSFNVRRVHIDKMVAQVDLITVPQPGPIRVQATGKPETMREFHVRSVGDELVIRLDTDEDEAWFPWNLFNMWGKDRKAQDLRLRITAPVGTPYEIEGMIGSIVGGDLDAPLRLEAHAVDARFGRVQSAKISIEGAGRINVGAIKETLDLEVAGSGDFSAASMATAQVQIAGGGDVVLGPVAGSFDAEVAGSGDIKVAQVNGAVDIEIMGSGGILIEAGQANPFAVEIAGSGDVVFKGHAVNPKVDILGSGDVTVGSYSGSLDQDIAGSGSFKSLNQSVPPAPAGPTPPAAPTPPAPPKPPGKF